MNANEVDKKTPQVVVKSLFLKYDENNNGTLSLNELRHVVYDCGYYLDDEELASFARDIDANDNDGISFEEFFEAVTSSEWQKCLNFLSTETGAQAVQWFQQYDANKSGSLSLDEWKFLWADLQRFYPDWEEVQTSAEAGFKKVNQAGDSIKFNEFMAFMKYG